MIKPMTLKEFLSFFPKVELPVSLSEDKIEVFSKNNKVFPPAALHEFIHEWDATNDDFTEFIPCFQIDAEGDFKAIVYWKGGLLKYDYYLVTLSKKGELIARKTIASTIVEDHVVKRSVALIDEDLIIHIVAGQSEDGNKYQPDSSQAFNMEISVTGDILFSLGDE